MGINDFYQVLAELFGTYAAGLLIALGLGILASFFFYFKIQLRPGHEYQGEDEASAAVREGYADWRSRLGEGGWFPTIYEGLLRRVLDGVDRFYDGPSDNRLHMSGYWSGAALDRCLLIALVYPVMSVIVVWHLTGQAGPVELALQLPEDASAERRLLSAVALGGLMTSLLWLFRPLPVHRRAMWAGLRLLTFAVAVAAAVAAAVAGAGAVAVAVRTKFWRRHFRAALAALLLVLLLLIAGAARLSRGTSEPEGLVLLLFLGALPIINAVFDWGSIGLTRCLLRLGLRRGGYRAFLYALLDLVAATILLAALLLTSLAFIEGLNRLAGTAILDVPGLLEIMRNDPGDPRAWWIYLTIFTTFIPSLVNLMLGGLSLMRAIPGLARWTVDQVLPDDPVKLTSARRFGASLVLTGQALLAGLAALFVSVLVLVVLLQGLDMIGLGLLGLAESSQSWIAGF